MTQICSRCGNQNDDDKKFCTSCGNALAPMAVQPAVTPTPTGVRALSAARTGQHTAFRIINGAGIAIIVFLAVLFFVQVFGTPGILPLPAVTLQATPTPIITSYVVVENPTPDPTALPQKTTIIVTESPRTTLTTTKAVICPSDRRPCDVDCTDIMTDSSNCGACGVSCSPFQTCQQGYCKARCSAGQTSCFDGCHDLMQDTQNCGTCGNSCPTGLVCNNSMCTPPLMTEIPTYSG